MQSLQACTEEAENLLYHSRKCIPKFNYNAVSNGKQVPSLFQKLAEIRKEELRSIFFLADPLVKQNHIKLTDSKLIEKLVKREHLNTLIFNLYPANKGYTVSVIVRNPDNTEKILSSMRVPYTEEHFLSYIDNEEIPPLLCSMIDNCIVQLYYNSCVIAEIRDYRKSIALTNYVVHHVLLHQSMQTIINDVNEALGSDSKIENKLTARLELEKTLLLANYGPLCLNPNPSVAIANQKLHYSKYFLNTHKLRYKARKHTLLGIAQRKRQEQFTKCSHYISGLVDFIAEKKASQRPKSKTLKKLLPECPVGDDFWTEAARTVLELAKPIQRPLETKDSIFNSKIIEEYIIETRDDARLQFMIKLLISQRNADQEYIGEIQQSRELNTGGFHNICYSFPLGTRELATRYVLEFTNVYTERGKIRINFTHKVPGKSPEVHVTSSLRIEGNKLVPIEQKSLELDTLVSLETLTSAKNEPKTKNVINVSKSRSVPDQIVLTSGNIPNVIKQISISSDSLTPTQVQRLQDQNLQMQNQQQILQQKRLQQQNRNLQQQRSAIENFKAQIQEHRQIRQGTVNGVISQNVPQFTSLLKKEVSTANSSTTNQNATMQKTIATVLPKVVNTNTHYQTASYEIPFSEASMVPTSPSNMTSMNSSNSTILSLLANTSAQSSPSSSAANITLSNLLTSSTSTRSLNAGGQRVVAKRLNMPNTACVIAAADQQVATSLGNSLVIATASPNVTSGVAAVNAQPVIKLSLSSLQNRTAPVIHQRGSKNLAGHIITQAGTLKTASLVNSVQPVTVSSSGGIQIVNNIQNLSAMQSLLNSGTVTQTASGLRMKPAQARRNVVVGGLHSLTVNATSNGQSGNETHTRTINCAKVQTVGTSQVAGSAAHLSTGKLQTLAGTLTAAPTIGAIQLKRNVQTLPTTSVHIVTSGSGAQTINSANTTSTTLNSIQLNAVAPTGDGILTKGKRMRLSNSQEATSQASVGLPVSTLSALLSGTSVADGSSSPSKSNVTLVERNSSVTSTSQLIADTSSNACINLNNASNNNLGVQNVQVLIPGMAVPITLSLNIGDHSSNSNLNALSQSAQAVTTISNIMGTSVLLANSNAGSLKTSTLRTVASVASLTNVQGSTVQQLQLIGPVQRDKLNAQISNTVTARSLLNTNKVRLAVSPPNAVAQQQSGGQGQVLSITAQQQLQLALQKQAAQFQLHQGLTAAGGLKVAQKRRRSSVTTDGS